MPQLTPDRQHAGKKNPLPSFFGLRSKKKPGHPAVSEAAEQQLGQGFAQPTHHPFHPPGPNPAPQVNAYYAPSPGPGASHLRTEYYPPHGHVTAESGLHSPLAMYPVIPPASRAPLARTQQSDSELARQLQQEEHQALMEAEQALEVAAAAEGFRADATLAWELQQQEQNQAHGCGGAVPEFDASAPIIYPPILTQSSSYKLVCDRLERTPSTILRPRINSIPPPGYAESFEPSSGPGPPSSSPGPLPATGSPDRDRLLMRLDEYDLTERIVIGDGACQFRSLSDQLYGNPDHHQAVRETIVKHLEQHPERYAMYVPSDYPDVLGDPAKPRTWGDGGGLKAAAGRWKWRQGKDKDKGGLNAFRSYCKAMAKQGTWGDHVTLQAAADVYGLRINVLTSFKEEFVIKIEPMEKKSNRTLWISFWAEVHYNSIYPKEVLRV